MPLIEESNLVRDILMPALAAERGPGRVPGPGTGTPLPPYPARLMPLGAALRRRRSVREFAAGPVAAGELESITRYGLAAEQACWPSAAYPAVGLTMAAAVFSAAVFSAGELGRGLYLANADTGVFEDIPWQKGLLADLPVHYGPAPAMLFVCGSLARACAAYGRRGYPQLLVRAGAAGYGAWLAAVATGLAGCAYGRTSHLVTAAVSQRRGESLRHLFTIAIGRPLGEDPGDD